MQRIMYGVVVAVAVQAACVACACAPVCLVLLLLGVRTADVLAAGWGAVSTMLSLDVRQRAQRRSASTNERCARASGPLVCGQEGIN